MSVIRSLDLKLNALNTGADFDIVQSSPGDLDPHAVASVFKAYLRECERLGSLLVLPVTDIHWSTRAHPDKSIYPLL